MGALLRGVKREQAKRGQVIALPGSIKSVKKFQAQVYVGHVEVQSISFLMSFIILPCRNR